MMMSSMTTLMKSLYSKEEDYVLVMDHVPGKNVTLHHAVQVCM